MSKLTIDKELFKKRIRKLYAAWKNDSAADLGSTDCIVSIVGDNEVIYSKSTALQIWLFGYELSDTLIVLCEGQMVVLSSKKKLDFFKPIEKLGTYEDKENQGLPKIKLILRNKANKDKDNFEDIVELIKKSHEGKRVGVFLKDKMKGDFVDSWNSYFKDVSLEKMDATTPMAYILSVKDDTEIMSIKRAAQATMNLFQKYIKEQLLDFIDQDKKMKHRKFSAAIEEALTNKKFVPDVDINLLDMCYPVIIQSGGTYQLKFSVISDDRYMHYGTIVIMCGVRYKSYCANIGRTIIINPTDEQSKNYECLLKVEDAILDKLQNGVLLKDVYQVAIDTIKDVKSDLLESFTKSIGFGMGIEFKEMSLLISAKSQATAKTGQVYNINIGFTNLKNPSETEKEAKIYSLFISDTIIINNATPATMYTTLKKRLKNIAILIKRDSEQSESDDEIPEQNEMLGRGARNAILTNRTRDVGNEEKRSSHQRELSERMNTEAEERIRGMKEGTAEKKIKKSIVSYKNQSHLPKDDAIQGLRIFVDRRFETIILPIYGIPTPYHISTIKNISQSVEGDYTYLRINFFCPGSALGKIDNTNFTNPDATFLKEITYRSSNQKDHHSQTSGSTNLNTAFRIIKEVQKRFKTREAEAKETEGIIKQDALIVSQNRGNPKLKDLYLRPNIVTKRMTGTLEAHTNGFRFTSVRGDKVDILYNNIAHAFFQPCDGEMIIVIHFNLKHGIVFGKKKHADVQFYTEVGEITTDLGKHQYLHDRDDLKAEQAERELRHKLKSTFKNFCEKVEGMTKNELEFDIPFRELGFRGSPSRSTVLLQPTSGCLVNLVEWPPFVVTLDSVQFVHFERISFQLKSFDMVFISKDYHKKVAMINSIPMSQLDQIKDWLNSCDIYYSEGLQSLNWAKILKTITDDPIGFCENGGWSFLDSQDGENQDSDASDAEDESYQMSPDDLESDSSEVSDSGSDSENWSDEESGSGSGDELDSSEESGKDWDDLEEEAMKADKNRNNLQDEEEAFNNNKHSSSGGGGGGSKKRQRSSQSHRSSSSQGHRSGSSRGHRSSSGHHKSSSSSHKKSRR